jgi:integrase
MNNFEYKSVLAPFIDEFIRMKEALGVNNLPTKWILLELDRFYCRQNVNEPVITRKLIADWQQTRTNDHPKTLYAKYCIISQLARYMSKNGYDCYIPQLPRCVAGKTDFTPYIFTVEQIGLFFEKSDELRMHDAHMNCTMFCVPAILRLLYSTALRISEALSIRNCDVEFEKKYIHIRKSKNGHERIVPVNTELEGVLKQYIFYRNRMPIKSVAAPDGFLFIKPDGTYCKADTVYMWFRTLLSRCNIPFTGNHHGPRIHDFRHTAAVHAFVQMAHSGQDVYASLPVISTWLGHKSLSSTEKYVRLVEAMYPDLIGQSASVSAYVFPKITFTPGLS